MGRYQNEQGEEAGPILNSDTVAADGTRDRFTNTLRCEHCGQAGEIIWEENAVGHRRSGPQRRLIGISPGFHAEAGRTRSGDSVIVCTQCDTIQTD